MKPEDFSNPKNRAFIGKLSGVVGIICNAVLAVGKLIAGSISASVSVTADGLNNLSDAASSVVTLVGFKLAERPADKEHPYGHARFEYLAGLAVATMILIIGFELAKNSVIKIINPASAEFSYLTVCVLVISILVKAAMMIFYGKMGNKIQSATLAAAAADSRNDVLTTGAVLAAALAEHIFGWKIDGIMGLAVALFIVYSGVSLAKKTVSPLLGEGANHALHEQLTKYINSCPSVLGCHDLLVHDYGPGRRYATIHVEFDRKDDPIKCHEIIDYIERECMRLYETHLVIHYDPVITDDEEINKMRRIVAAALKMRDERLTIHDFRMHTCGERINLVFDTVLPPDLRGTEQELQSSLEEVLNSIDDKKYKTDIIFDMESE